MRWRILLLPAFFGLVACHEASAPPASTSSNGPSASASASPSPRSPIGTGGESVVSLPAPRLDGKVSVEKALATRRSVRDYSFQPLTMQEVAQLLWAAQGITDSEGRRTAPSAGALYPLEVYLVAGNVEGLSAGVYKYEPKPHQLRGVRQGDARSDLSRAAGGQESVRQAAASIVIGAVYERTTVKYGDRGRTYVHMEVGHAAQNVCLEATALGLGTVPVGAFDDAQVRAVVAMPVGEAPLYVLPVGRMK